MISEPASEHPASVAVITRTRNRAILLDRAILSVLNQTFLDWHHVIVNDGGDPEPVNQLLEGYRERYQGRLTLIHNESSSGMEAASNAGILASASRYVVIHDDDDSWAPGFLERCIGAYIECGFATVRGVVTHTTQIFERLEGNKVIEERRQELTPELAAISIPEISEINRFMPIAFLFERSVLDDVGMFDETLPVIGDWEFNIRFFMKYDAVVIRENLAFYHVRPASNDEFGNTVSMFRDKHEFYRALIVNKQMRNDISQGKLTNGMVLGLGEYFHHISSDVARIGRLLDKFKKFRLVNLLRKITGI